MEEPTAAYYRALTEKFDRELEAQIDIRMSVSLDQLTFQILLKLTELDKNNA